MNRRITDYNVKVGWNQCTYYATNFIRNFLEEKNWHKGFASMSHCSYIMQVKSWGVALAWCAMPC